MWHSKLMLEPTLTDKGFGRVGVENKTLATLG